ncbi:acyl carrier protein [Actinoplanes sp. CA-252034]|uniref:acyl carrier protein n=1 Tax=Actinoplanes sp. CA-252034 TaxID=3239906 RepID=UPI003D97E79F
MNVETVVHSVVLEVVNEVAGPREHLAADQQLVADLGLRSLDLARIVAVLEIEVGHDPFLKDVPVTSVRTVGDLVAAYLGTLAPQPTEPAPAGRRAVDPTARALRAAAREGRP